VKDSFLTILTIVFLFVAVPVLLLWIRDRVRGNRHRQTPEQMQNEALAYRERLLHPDQNVVEIHLAGFLPERLITLYSDATVLCRNLEIRPPRLGQKEFGEWIERFLPLDIKGQEHTVSLEEAGWGKGFCFAADGAGNFYWVPVSPARQPDAPVFFACHDPWGNEKIAESLDEFLSWPRVMHLKS
jgi:hypothetical protein